jgi:endo-1,3-1,4-beta-glycanase ExoK
MAHRRNNYNKKAFKYTVTQRPKSSFLESRFFDGYVFLAGQGFSGFETAFTDTTGFFKSDAYNGFWNTATLSGQWAASNVTVIDEMVRLQLTTTDLGGGQFSASAAELQDVVRRGFGTYEFRARGASTSSTPYGVGTAVSGNVTGLFNFFNGSETEIDFEIQGMSPTQLDTVTWAGLTNKHFQLNNVGVDLSQGFHDYKFIWTSSSIKFYLDGVLLWTATANVPQSPAYVIFNLWATNDSGFGGTATAGTVYAYVDNYRYTPLPALPSLTASSSLTNSGVASQDRTITASVNLPSLTATGSATYAAPARTITASTSLPALTAAGNVAYIPPARFLTGAVTLPSLTASSSMAYVPFAPTITGATTLPALTGTAGLTYTPVPLTITASSTLPTLTGSGAFSAIANSRQVDASLTLPALQTAGTLGYTPAPRTIGGNATLPALQGSGTIGSVSNDRTLSGLTQLPKISVTASFEYVAQPATITASVLLPAFTATAALATSAHTLAHEDRTITLHADTRVFDVRADRRVFTIAVETRMTSNEAMSRTIEPAPDRRTAFISLERRQE